MDILEQDLPLVSVIIPTYGRSEFLIRAVNSVLEQTYSNIEVIIVNDNKKTSKEYIRIIEIEETYKKLNNVRFINDGLNKGGGLARNVGIKHASGAYIGFLDDDDYYINTKIYEQVDYIIKNSLDCCLCDMLYLNNGEFKDVSNCYARGKDIVSFLVDGNAYTPMIMVKASVLKIVGGFEDTPRFQDHVLMIKILGSDFKNGILNKKLFVHNNHSIGERITFSDKLYKGYMIRWAFESKYIYLLNERELHEYNFKKKNIELKIDRANKNFIKIIVGLYDLYANVRSFNDFILASKTFIRISFFPKRPI